jgi:RNA polymerase sigma factor (sigma-70 family)
MPNHRVTPPLPDPALLRGVSTALKATLARYRRMILSIGYRHGLDEADVDEVLQEVRVRLWSTHQDAETLAGLGSSYVYQTAASASVDILRRRRAARTGVEAVAELTPNLASRDRGPVAVLEEREFADRIFAAVDQLPDARRAVVRMYLAGYGRREIAQALACAETRVRNLLHRGLVELRERLVLEGIGPLEVLE